MHTNFELRSLHLNKIELCSSTVTIRVPVIGKRNPLLLGVLSWSRRESVSRDGVCATEDVACTDVSLSGSNRKKLHFVIASAVHNIPVRGHHGPMVGWVQCQGHFTQASLGAARLRCSHSKPADIDLYLTPHDF